jgi:predicted HicB family RNase H-like nuclease
MGSTDRRSQRLTITVPSSVSAALAQRAQAEGRSLSNLAAHLIEQHVQDNQPQRKPESPRS